MLAPFQQEYQLTASPCSARIAPDPEISGKESCQHLRAETANEPGQQQRVSVNKSLRAGYYLSAFWPFSLQLPSPGRSPGGVATT